MPDGDQPVAVRILSGLDEIPSGQWDACAGTGNPFVSHAFLKALEDSQAASAESGWLPQHLAIDDGGETVAVAPCYLKNHSYGEYVFDWGWAEAFQRAGGRYYPKLQVAVPFSPVTGPRLLVRPGQDGDRMRALLTAGLVELARQHEVSSLHVTFAREEEWRLFGSMGLLQRVGQQFHWKNEGFSTFDDFLASLNSRKRKMIRKERATANRDVEIEVLTGDEIGPHHVDSFYRFYLNTVDRKWAHAYLNGDFFHLLRERLADRMVLVMARHDGDFVAGALNLRGAETLYGRNWGCAARFRMLYFECCFYRAIEYAIEHGLDTVEAGAQGPHKISRGYLPTPTYSAHWIRDSGFRDAVADFLKRERRGVAHEMEQLAGLSPFRITDDSRTA